jgi:hypothetical protein
MWNNKQQIGAFSVCGFACGICGKSFIWGSSSLLFFVYLGVFKWIFG